MSDEPTMKKLSVYHMDPTNPRPYKMDRRKYNKIIGENLKMNEDLVMTPDDERYHLSVQTAVSLISCIFPYAFFAFMLYNTFSLVCAD